MKLSGRPAFLNLAIFGAFFITAAFASAQEKSEQPYIDRLKQGIDEKPASPGAPSSEESYTERKKRELGPEAPEGSYLEKLKAGLHETPAPGGESYTEREKARLEAKEAGQKNAPSAIEKFKAGQSELEAKRLGAIHQAFGVRMGTSSTRDVTAVSGTLLRPFSSVYGASWAPDVTIFYEYQPFHSEWFGNIGLMLSGGVSYFHGKGTFQFPLPGFALESKTRFNFFELPLTAALNYRFNLLRVLRPFVAAGPNVIGYMEGRSDSKSGYRGYATGLWLSGGVAILLDWISPSSTWNLYAEHDIKHYYLTLEFNKQTTFTGDVKFANSGVYAGLAFEY